MTGLSQSIKKVKTGLRGESDGPNRPCQAPRTLRGIKFNVQADLNISAIKEIRKRGTENGRILHINFNDLVASVRLLLEGFIANVSRISNE